MAAKKILVIEDNELNMKLVRSLLSRDGYGIVEATDAESGIHLAREHHPDLILMDIQLPGMDGLSATRVLNADSGLKEIPIVALTSYAMQKDKEEALDAGCAGHITKPLDTRTFSDNIAQYLRENNA